MLHRGERSTPQPAARNGMKMKDGCCVTYLPPYHIIPENIEPKSQSVVMLQAGRDFQVKGHRVQAKGRIMTDMLRSTPSTPNTPSLKILNQNPCRLGRYRLEGIFRSKVTGSRSKAVSRRLCRVTHLRLLTHHYPEKINQNLS